MRVENGARVGPSPDAAGDAVDDDDRAFNEIIDDCATFELDPLGFVMWAFDWGEGELAGLTGPRKWQAEVLVEMGRQLRAGMDIGCVIQIAIASGHGPGKSTLVAWIILWAMSTFEDTRGVVTASTDTQLKTKTWPEVSKWHRLAINAFMFKCTATAIYSAEPGRDKNWRIDAIPWSEENSEAFAGLHNKGKRILVLCDEASAIADKIWEVIEGALTDERTQIIWGAFGNPTKNTGRFRECFGKFKHRWWTRQIDTRKVEGVNLTKIGEWEKDWGVDSDFFKVRVRGEFPSSSDMQFISSSVVEAARKREAVCHMNDPMIVGVDVARFGSSKTVITVRKGRDARSFGTFRYRGLDTVQVALKVFEVCQAMKVRNGNTLPDGIFIDGGGVGGGVVDNCRKLGLDVIEVQFGGKADRSGTLNEVGAPGERYMNKRAEMWGAGREWLKGGAIEDSGELQDDLIGPEYGLNARDEIVLESKEDMLKRGLASPDEGDSLMLTFAYPVNRKALAGSVEAGGQMNDYDPYA